MAEMKIAVMTHNLKMADPWDAFRATAELGVPGVHLSVGRPPFRPDDLDGAARRRLVADLRALGLQISALALWGGRVHLEQREGIEPHLEEARKTTQLAADLDCGIWMAHIGILPQDEASPGWAIAVEHAAQIARWGEQYGAALAIETGPEPPRVLRRFIETIGSPALKVNYDPANLILWSARYALQTGRPYDREQVWRDYQPEDGVNVLGDLIVHTHAKDALVRPDGQRQEVPLGQGWLDWDRYLANHAANGYTGYFAIEREVGPNPLADVRHAVQFLRSKPYTPVAAD